MKKLFPILVLVVVLGGAWFYSQPKVPAPSPTKKAKLDPNKLTPPKGDSGSTTPDRVPAPNAGSPDAPAVPLTDDPKQLEDGEDDSWDEEVTPATELYSSSDEALEAVKKGAVDYDDLVLEQFVELEDCKWCGGFYDSVKNIMRSEEVSEDERSYYAEILAISGRVDNIQALIGAIAEAPSEDQADIYAEALEVTIGDDKVVEFLSGQLSTDNDLLKESLLAAVTNHGSRLAVDVLYRHTVTAGDPDGYYSLGIGLGEVIPDDDALPYITELVKKRDAYSHLGVKALLNSGTEGLRILMDVLENSKDPDFDRQMLKDAVDHVNYEDETEEYVKKLATSKNPVVKEFAQEILDDFDLSEEDEN